MRPPPDLLDAGLEWVVFTRNNPHERRKVSTMRRVITIAAIGAAAAMTTGLLATSALAGTSSGPGPGPIHQVPAATQIAGGYGPGDGICDGTCDGTPDRTRARDLTGTNDQQRDQLHDGSCLITP